MRSTQPRRSLANSFGPLAAVAAFAVSPLAVADEIGDLERRLDRQAKEIQELREAVEMAGDMLEQTTAAGGGSQAGHRPQQAWGGRTQVGGYGELHYTITQQKKEIDAHRTVLFVGHEFDERTRFFMEWDLEHAKELDLEQAYLEFDLTQDTRALAGVMLLPFGIVNQTHEPPTFYGVERNPVETYIIPTTWREGGAALAGRFADGWSYDLYATSGMNLSAATDYKVRYGRQGAAKAVANDLAYSARIKWTGLPGVELAGALLYTTDAAQGQDNDVGKAALMETHAVFSRGRATLKALYAAWRIDGDAPKAIGADRQNGWYVEPSFRLSDKLGIFARYNRWDNTAGDAGGDSEISQVNAGLNYWPIENVVLKLDVMQQNDAGDNKGANLGVGYMF